MFLLYQQDLLRLSPQAVLKREIDGEVSSYARSLVLGVDRRRSEIDATLQRHISGWSIDRLGMVERSVLRLATYELLWEPDVPGAVAIDEAVALARRYCSDEAGALINGVLGAVLAAERNRGQQEPARAEPPAENCS